MTVPSTGLESQRMPVSPDPTATLLSGGKPLVSIIMPVYNAEKTVSDSINSVLNQTYPHWELLVVVDGSPDNSVAVVRSFTDPRIQLIEQANQGVSTARNNGFAHAKGEYIAYLDSDDIWMPGKLDKELATLRQHNTPVGFTYSWYYAFNDAFDLVNVSPAYTDAGMIFDAVVKKENLIIPSTALLHRSIVEAVGGYVTSLAHHEDFLFFLQVAKDYPGFPTGERLVLYRQSTQGSARSQLNSLESAKKAYINDNPLLRAMFSAEEYATYQKRQKKTLFYALMMYNHMASARQLYHEDLSPQDIQHDLKGKLCLISMLSGVNMLYVCRTLYQFAARSVLKPWWKRKMKQLFQPH